MRAAVAPSVGAVSGRGRRRQLGRACSGNETMAGGQPRQPADCRAN